MKIAIRHTLRIPVASGVARAVEHLLLTPVSGPTQTVREWTIDMPGIAEAARFTDAFGNRALLVSQAKPDGELEIVVAGEVETIDGNGVVGRFPGEPVIALYRRVTPLTASEPRFVEAFKDVERYGRARIALFHSLMEHLGEVYRFGATADGPPAVETQAQGGQSQSQNGQSQSQGVAEAVADDRAEADAAAFAHAFIGTLRALDIPARYVTGYLAADDEQPAAFHAWAEAYDDGLGWIGFDAALGVCPTDRHIRVAAGLDMLSTLALRTVPPLLAMPTEEVSVEPVAG